MTLQKLSLIFLVLAINISFNSTVYAEDPKYKFVKRHEAQIKNTKRLKIYNRYRNEPYKNAKIARCIEPPTYSSDSRGRKLTIKVDKLNADLDLRRDLSQGEKAELLKETLFQLCLARMNEYVNKFEYTLLLQGLVAATIIFVSEDSNNTGTALELIDGNTNKILTEQAKPNGQSEAIDNPLGPVEQ